MQLFCTLIRHENGALYKALQNEGIWKRRLFVLTLVFVWTKNIFESGHDHHVISLTTTPKWALIVAVWTEKISDVFSEWNRLFIFLRETVLSGLSDFSVNNSLNNLLTLMKWLFFFQDIDECLRGNCSTDAECKNTDGSFSCRCKTGYQGNGFNCSGMWSLKLMSLPRYI